MAAQTLFVTGTDTGVGKTRVALALLRALRTAGIDAVGFKPVASGARRTPAGLRNADAMALWRAGPQPLAYRRVNPCCFAPPIAPHLAAREARRRLSAAQLDRAHDWLARRHAVVVVEGAGGWHVPLDGRERLSDWVLRRGWPVLLVVGLRLGCLNHAMLSAEAIGAPLSGWVANLLPPPLPRLTGNLATLRRVLPAPQWFALDCGESPATAARRLDREQLAAFGFAPPPPRT
ncbi:MAG: dethiobiotin synthase [Gammaproteobacteria bacterium]|nr:dethiobiotin synthase [Gammaproteobacteria bacterium]